jgi:hypothetical protein
LGLVLIRFEKVPHSAWLESTSVLVLAHAGHWLADIVVFLPVVAFAVWFLAVTIRDRHRGRPVREPGEAPHEDGA